MSPLAPAPRKSREHNVPTDGKTTEELVAERLALSDGIKTTVLDLLGVELDGSLGELEPLLNERGKLPDAASLLSENLLGVGGADDDLGAGVGDADLAARVTLRGEGASEELAKLGAVEGQRLATGPGVKAFCSYSLEDSLSTITSSTEAWLVVWTSSGLGGRSNSRRRRTVGEQTRVSGKWDTLCTMVLTFRRLEMLTALILGDTRKRKEAEPGCKVCPRLSSSQA